MGAPNTRIPFTYEDYKSLPESMDRRYELMDGELLMVPAPTTLHQIVSQNIEFLLLQHVRATGCGRILHAPVDVVLGEGKRRDVVQPDIVFISNARAHIVTKPEVAGAPDLVIEILSPGTEDRDRGYKRTLYERMGVREYWIVDPEGRTVEVFRAGQSGFMAPRHYGANDELAVTVIEGLRLPLSVVFDLNI
jgi:Uma2 family endonuclease